MRLKRTAIIILSGLLSLLVIVTKCKGPYQLETHPVIWVNAFEFIFAASELGANPSPQVLKIKNTGVETLSYTLTTNANWLRVSPTSGTSSGQVNEHLISVDKTGMTAKEEGYEAKIVISSSEACNSPQEVKAVLKLTKEPPPEISVTPRELKFIASVGGSNPPSQIIRIRNSGQQTLNYTIADDAAWLDVSPTSGSSTGGENSHSVSVNISGLATGTYSGSITISDPNAVNNPRTVSVTLELGTAPPPTISVRPSSLRFDARIGGQNPAPQSIGVRNSGQGTLNYVIDDDAAWLNVSPSSGTSTGQENGHTVNVNISGLNTGTYTARVTISSSGAANSPQYVDVTLVISALPTSNKIEIFCSPTSGQSGQVIDVIIAIDGNTNEIKSFGLDVSFDTAMFAFVPGSFSKGSLTGSWLAVTGNLLSAGKVKIGGLVGDPSAAIRVGSSGSIATFRLQVTCSGCNDGAQSQVCMSNPTDDIASMNMGSGCTTFTFKK